MVAIKEIRLKRAEGRNDLVDRHWRTFKTFSSANNYLRFRKNKLNGMLIG